MNKNKSRKFYNLRQLNKAKKSISKDAPATAPAGYKTMWNYSLQQFEQVKETELWNSYKLNPQSTYAPNGIASTLRTRSSSSYRLALYNFNNPKDPEKQKGSYLH